MKKLNIDLSFVNKPSVLFIIFCFCFCFFTMDLWRKWHFEQNNFSWDVANYYSYLPAKFCNNDSFKFNNGVSDYLQVSPTGVLMSRGTYGMALMYSPFFALGYKVAINQRSALDGFSEPFATCLHWGSIIYVLLGLILLRNLLVKFFSEKVTTITLAIVFLGTQLFYYTMGDSEMTHGYLFFLISAFLLVGHNWHQKVTFGRTLLLGFLIGLITLIRPPELLTVIIFILWGVNSIESLKTNIFKFLRNWLHVLIMALVGIALWIPQFLFWKEYAGTYFYSSYAELNERFFWNDPQIINILFSYRKGWVTYTPLIVLAFIGFFFMKGELKKYRPGILIVLLLNLYILSCWWDWFFGGCFAARGFCQHIAYLSFPIAACTAFIVEKLSAKKSLAIIQLVFYVVVCSGISLNLGQSYQYAKHYIHFNSMTKEAYWFVFGKYYLDPENDGRFYQSLREPDYKKLKDGTDRDQ